jgi:hypothetical protein
MLRSNPLFPHSPLLRNIERALKLPVNIGEICGTVSPARATPFREKPERSSQHGHAILDKKIKSICRSC